MKILQVISSFPPAYAYGGPAKVAYDISKELVKRGHEVTVYATDACDAQSRLKYDENPMWMDGIEVHHFKNVSNKLVRKNYAMAPIMALALNKNIKDFDVIHLHEYRSVQAAFVQHFAKKYSIPYVLQAHGALPRIIEKKGLKYLFDVFFGFKILRDTSKVIAVSNIEVDQYLKMGVSKDKIVVVPNGIDVDSFNNLPEKSTFRKQYGISEKYIILFLGRLHEIKGIDFLIKSYAELRKELDDVVLILAGSDDGYKAKAKMLINDLNLTNEVRFIGHVNGVNKLAAYVDADVLVYPSVFEIFGLVPFEAIMCGTPVIVTDDCGCGELVNTAQCGLLVKFGDEIELKESIKSIIKNPELKTEMVQRGKLFIEETLTLDEIVVQIERVYRSCTNDIL